MKIYKISVFCLVSEFLTFCPKNFNFFIYLLFKKFRYLLPCLKEIDKSMKKSTIWLLVGVMGFTFIGLILLQLYYVSTMIKTANVQFDATIKRCLERVSHFVELDEARNVLFETLKDDFKGTQETNPEPFINNSNSSVETLTRQFSVGTIKSTYPSQTEIYQIIEKSVFSSKSIRNQPSRDAIIRASEEQQKNQQARRHYYSGLLNEVIYDLENSAPLKPIEERIDFGALDEYIYLELSSDGLDIPYIFMIIDKDGHTIFQNKNFDSPPKVVDLVTQVLFPSDPPSRRNYLKIYFPTKMDYITSSVTFFVPSIAFSLILLLTFAFTIYTIFRQKKLSEMKSDFVNNMTHELKTPVSTISLAAQMLKDTDMRKNPDVFHHISGVINDETRRLGFLVEKVLQISLFERQKATLKLKEIDSNDLLISVVNTFALKVEKFGGNIDFYIEAEESTIYADEMHITNVLFNLLDNALKYRRHDVPLQLIAHTSNDNNKLYISIEDNGIGIKKEHLKKIFERFYRVPTGNVHNVKGFGLGLAYVRKILNDHGGSIRAEQPDERKTGTKFIITLPLLNKNQ